ncbi:hypothetical protein Glove_165g137 [Diversispora epigaea]|uniref:Uncharacterized protein n=1 Tax=Diversispora epigaea TaxID=1348612 RepID=A0A397IQX5_9GLOM|nr:hypothetical protein Glove_165g137 [Diversispora epigaea]
MARTNEESLLKFGHQINPIPFLNTPIDPLTPKDEYKTAIAAAKAPINTSTEP